MQETLERAELSMKKAVEHFKKDLAAIRTGRASPALLEKVMVDYYGVPTPVNQLATITAPEPRLLVIQPWDRSIINEIEKAILKSDLGLTPNNDGQVIRLILPQLTQERREELVRVARKRAEEARVAIRNIRREANDELKEKQKKENVSEDEIKRLQGEVQKLTEKYIKEVDNLLAAKEKEIMEV